jgi:NDP-sugar pyrophosphorylase family protein
MNESNHNSTKLNIVVPMAGRGKRFLDQGYKTPKPLLEVGGKTMIEWVVKSVMIPGAQLTFIIRKDHDEEYKLGTILKEKFPGCNLILLDRVTEGAICTVLLAQKYINNDTPMIIKDCDQILDWSPEHFWRFVKGNKVDGAIVTVVTQHPGYSFCKLDSDNLTVIETAEKRVISNIGNAGLYYFSKGSDLVTYAALMIAKNIRTNNEFYVSPVYNEFIEDGKKIIHYPIARVFGLNTPEEFEAEKDAAVKIFEK